MPRSAIDFKPSKRRLAFARMPALILALLAHCGVVKDIEPPTLFDFLLGGSGRNQIGVVTSDLGPAGRFTRMSPEGVALPGGVNIHSDAVARFWNNRVYIVNQLNRDNIQTLDPDLAYLTVQEFSVGSKANPHDFVYIDPRRAAVSLYNRDYLLFVDPASGVETQRVSLAPFADPGDGIPEMSGMFLDGGRLYVAVQRLDRNSALQTFPPTDYSSLIEIDAATGVILNEHRMQGKNPFSQLRSALIDGERHIYWTNPALLGVNFAPDGGVEAFNLERRSFRPGFLYSEALINADILDVVIRDPQTAYAIVEFADLSLALHRFNPSTGAFVSQLAFYPASAGFVSGLLLPGNGYLYAADASFSEPGIIIYDTNNNDRRLTPRPVSVGLRPVDLVYIP